MALLRGFLLILFVLFQVQIFAQTGKVIIVNTTSKELKRDAHRLRIPVEQLKNAQQSLQEATDLLDKIDPYPINQLSNLAQAWQRLNKSKAKDIIGSFIENLRSQAAQPADYPAYQRATSMAMTLAQIKNESDYEKVHDMIRSWPDPPESFGEAAAAFRKNLETQAQAQEISRMAYSDPEKASKLLSQSGGISPDNYDTAAQIAQGFMNKGKSEEAMKLLDQAIADFKQHAGDARVPTQFMSFVSVAARIDSKRAETAAGLLANQLINQRQPAACKATLKSGDTSVDLTCNEMSALSILRSLSTQIGGATQALNSVPALKAKLDKVGGADSVFNGQASMMVDSIGGTKGSGAPLSVSLNSLSSPNKLIQELKGKSETNPAWVKQKLREAAKGPEDINVLTNLAMSAAYNDPELADLALEIAQSLLSLVEPLQKRASSLQNMVQAYRQADGEVDQELLKEGFIIADQLRQEMSEKNKAQSPRATIVSGGVTNAADQLEASLISELSRDSFESAIRYVRSMDTGIPKLTNFIQIAQALSQPNY
jgi:alkanesulfonate monooxygenase SsuD/methylene tetrahydromethanopterin reductase-like flavin-dependent oxidoreductase (luciferase family)